MDRSSVLLTGDALVNFDYASGKSGIALHRFNDDRQAALESLSRFEGLQADVVLFGHGDPWQGGAAKATEIARESA